MAAHHAELEQGAGRRRVSLLAALAGQRVGRAPLPAHAARRLHGAALVAAQPRRALPQRFAAASARQPDLRPRVQRLVLFRHGGQRGAGFAHQRRRVVRLVPFEEVQVRCQHGFQVEGVHAGPVDMA